MLLLSLNKQTHQRWNHHKDIMTSFFSLRKEGGPFPMSYSGPVGSRALEDLDESLNNTHMQMDP